MKKTKKAVKTVAVKTVVVEKKKAGRPKKVDSNPAVVKSVKTVVVAKAKKSNKLKKFSLDNFLGKKISIVTVVKSSGLGSVGTLVGFDENFIYISDCCLTDFSDDEERIYKGVMAVSIQTIVTIDF